MAMAPHVFCTDCGTQNKFTSNFCFKCGNALQKEVVNNNRHPDTISKSSANHPQSSCSAQVADSSNANGNSSALGREATQKKRQNISGYKYSTCKNGHDLESVDVKKLKALYGFKYHSKVGVECDVCKLPIHNYALHCDECEFDKCKDCWTTEKNDENEEDFTIKINIDTAHSTNPRRSSRIANR
eukprot:231616_1